VNIVQYLQHMSGNKHWTTSQYHNVLAQENNPNSIKVTQLPSST